MDGYGESVFNLIPPKQVAQEKPPMYRSKHNPGVPPTSSTFHQSSTTMPRLSNLAGLHGQKVIEDRSARLFGKPPGSNKNTPREYLQKATNMQPVPTLAEVRRCNPELLQPTTLKPRLKGGVTPRDMQPVLNLVTSKNFVVSNAVEAILAAPRKNQDSGKDYIKKEDYGKVPRYLHHIKGDIEAEYDYIRAIEQQREDMTRSHVRGLEEEERHELINGLKDKWESINTDYQATTHLTKLDTIGKTKRKEKYESELSQIEKDIEKLNRKNIMVNAGY